jgi:hypothetical protein
MEYTLANVQKDLEKIQVSIAHIEKMFCSELHTVTKLEEANELFGRDSQRRFRVVLVLS